MKPMRIATATLLLLCVVPRARAQLGTKDSTTRANVRAAIDRGNAEYIQALAKSDAEAFASVYAPDGARMAPQGELIRGHAAIADGTRKLLQGTGPIDATIGTEDLWVVNDIAYETGKWQYKFTPVKKPTQVLGGRYMTIWKKQPNGHWRIVADMSIPGTETHG